MGKDAEWLPSSSAKPKPKNFSLLEARKKKFKSKKKIVVKCNVCTTKFINVKQMLNHKLTHGSYWLYIPPNQFN